MEWVELRVLAAPRGLQFGLIERMMSSCLRKFSWAKRVMELDNYIVTDREILGGEPVFRGTRVPVASLFEYLESDCPLDEFLENFPSVTRQAAVAVLVGAQELTLERARG